MREQLIEIAARIEACSLADRRRLIGRLRSLRREACAGRDFAGRWAQFLESIEQAEKATLRRREQVPAVTFPEDLPVSQRREEIAEAIRSNQVIVLCGETGSGKTTQLPKICLSLGLGVRGMIGHTQPRRIAARSVAQRIAEELETPLGQAVGYKVRFGDKTSPGTFIKLMTDGILLAETQGDRDLEQYDTIIVDEAHERSLNIDFLLGYLRRLLSRRPDLKVIVTSATIDPERFSRHFGSCPIVMVEGRTYPVEVLYRPAHEEGLDERDEEFQGQIVRAVDEAASYGPGDILVFLSGEREIRETAETLQKHHVAGDRTTSVLPLYARLSAEEQMRVFRPHEGRRVVLATNVAETSLTVPGIRYVVDPGFARLNRYSPRTKVQRLEIEAISRASADQRKGRCGRTGPGVCIRLYAEDDYRSRPEYTDPEIVRSNLASVILQMAALRLGRVEEFPFVDPPDSRLIKDGRDTLHELGAMREDTELTRIGHVLAGLPVDPRIGRMIVAASEEECLPEVLVIGAALSVQDPRERPLDKQAAADEAHALFKDERSDFLGYLRLWKFYREQKRHLSGSKLRKLCRERFLSFVRLREWEEVHTQLAAMAGALLHPAPATPPVQPGARGKAARRAPAPMPGPAQSPSRKSHPLTSAADAGEALDDAKRIEAIHRALLTGLLSNVGVRGETGEYTGCRGVKFNLFPGSALFKSGPRWVMSSEIVRTTKLYARTNAAIQPEWIERIASHLLARSYFDPHWHRESGRVVAFERASLFGLDIVQRRRVHYAPIAPDESRVIFIHHALVEGELDLVLGFIVHNAELVASLRAFEVKTRRQNLLAHPTTRFDFFDRHVPKDVHSSATFERWYREASRRDPRLLYMSVEDCVEPGTTLPTIENFPDILETNGLRLVLDYKHHAGATDDGVTARLPLAAFGRLGAERAAWLVPGWIPDKVEHLLRSLGKEHRRLLPPAGELAQRVASRLRFGVGSLFQQVSEAIRVETGQHIPPEVLERSPLPDYLRLRIEVVSDDGKIIASGRDLAELRAILAPVMKAGAGGEIAGSGGEAARFHRDGLRVWDWPDLNHAGRVERFGTMFSAHPGVVDQTTSVGLRLFDTEHAAIRATRAGLLRLFRIECAFDLQRRTKGLPALERMCIQAAGLGGGPAFRDAFQGLVASLAFYAQDLPVPLTRGDYEARRRSSLERLDRAVREAANTASPIMDAYAALRARLAGSHPAAWDAPLADIGEQLTHLLPPEFLTIYPPERLSHLPRYLSAIDRRLERLSGPGVAKDERCMAELAPVWKGALELMRREKELGLDPAKVQEFRWMVEELRVSLFAQELRTSVPVSVKRLHELWASVVRGS